MEPMWVAGIDEAGVGPLAGPVTAACVVLPVGYLNPCITDSKKLTAATRERLFSEIVKVALAYAIVSVGPRRIERLNIREATKLAMVLAAIRVSKQAEPKNVYFLADGNLSLATEIPAESIVKGDQKFLSIAAASILAKVYRDRLMHKLEAKYPGYGLAVHKGYGTKKHRDLISLLGPCRIHRQTFAGVLEHINQKTEVFAEEKLSTKKVLREFGREEGGPVSP